MKSIRSASLILSVAMAAWLAAAAGISACPFCNAESQTLSEETGSADAVVLAKLVEGVKPADDQAEPFPNDPDAGTAKFRIVDVLQGADAVGGTKEIDVVFFGEADLNQVFLISGIGTDRIDWTTPLPLSTAAVEYVRKLPAVPPSGVERLAFFQEYLESDDPLLAQDAYDEFARAPYADVQTLKPRMHRDRLLKWIADNEISPSRRRLYLTMLGVCGTTDDLPLLESLIASDFQAMKPHLEQSIHAAIAMGAPVSLPVWLDLVDQQERQKKLGLDALVACYLTLRGPDGLDLIDKRFLTNPKTEYTYIYSTIMALRFHGEEPTSHLPRERLLNSMRLLLDNAEFADQVIPDLSRWEDWSVLDRLVSMFKSADKNSYVRQPVVTYLTVASEQPGEIGSRASTALTELEQLDPEGVKQARSLMAFGTLGRARASSAAAAPDSVSTTETPAAEAASPAADDSGEFAATAAEIQESQESKPEDFPDPAEYSAGEPAGETTTGEPADAEDAAVTPSPNGVGASERPAVDATQETAGDVTPPAAGDVTRPAAEAASPTRADLNSTLVIGVPLGAAVLLMGVYWLILRTGAL